MKPSPTPMGINDAIEITNEAAMHGYGNWMTAAVSGLALVGSAVSLWETTLKQPQIELYVSENIQYTRDPYGSYEVFAVPITIVNGGARDGAVLSLDLDIKNSATGKIDRFKSTYTADAQYFGSRDDLTEHIKRPKVPFAPLSVAGRSAYTGTILFYGPAPTARDQELVPPKSSLEMTLSLAMPPLSNLLEKALTAIPRPVTFKAEVPDFLVGVLYSGENLPLRVTSGAQ